MAEFFILAPGVFEKFYSDTLPARSVMGMENWATPDLSQGRVDEFYNDGDIVNLKWVHVGDGTVFHLHCENSAGSMQFKFEHGGPVTFEILMDALDKGFCEYGDKEYVSHAHLKLIGAIGALLNERFMNQD